MDDAAPRVAGILNSKYSTSACPPRQGTPPVAVPVPSVAQVEAERELLLRANVGRLGRLVERLERRVEDLEQEATALKGCLEDDGVLRSERFMARLHRAQFQMALRTHPCHCEASLPDILLVKELRSALGGFLGWPMVRYCASLGRCTKELLFTVPHMIYMCGGFDGSQILATLQRFDPTTWCPWFLGDRDVRKGKLSQAADDDATEGCLFLCGGRRDTERTEETTTSLGLGSISMGSWEQLPPMAHCRAGFAAGVCADAFLVCGGFDGKNFLRSVERFRISPLNSRGFDAEGVGKWEEVATMRQRRHCATAAALIRNNGEVLYVCGGYNGEEVLKCTERFDPYVGEWEYAAPMVYSRHGAAAAVLKGCLYVCGGMNEEEMLNTVERFDPAAGVWETVASMTERRNAAVATVLNGQLYVCGGTNGRETLHSVECFDPVQNTWSEAPPLVRRRHGAAGTSALGQLFVYGGAESAVGDPTSGQPLDEVECFSPGLQTWRRLAPMSAPRLDMAVVSMCSPA